MKLDAGRLGVFNTAELRQIAIDSTRAIGEQLDLMDRALAAGRAADAGEAAHRALGEALLVGARELSEALAELQRAARAGERSSAREALERAREVWPATRAAIAALASADQDATD